MNEIDFKVFCVFEGFDLDRFDEWLADQDQPDLVEQMTGQRKAAFDHFAAGREDDAVARIDAIWYRWQYLQNIRPTAQIGDQYRQDQRARATAGADARWSAQRVLADCIKRLKAPRFSEYRKHELWPELWSLLDQLELDPQEVEDPVDMRRSVITWDGGGRITFGAFQNRMNRRKS